MNNTDSVPIVNLIVYMEMLIGKKNARLSASVNLMMHGLRAMLLGLTILSVL